MLLPPPAARRAFAGSTWASVAGLELWETSHFLTTPPLGDREYEIKGMCVCVCVYELRRGCKFWRDFVLGYFGV